MIGNAAEAEVFDGGDGLDSLDFRFGPAVTVALDGSFENEGAGLGDIYVAFERVTGSVQGDVIRGDAQANQLLGQAGADVIDGAAGADLIRGGAGEDVLTGGLGNDIFRFQTLTECGDVITDFLNLAGDNDKFQILASTFGGGLVAGALAATQFQSRADNVAQDADDRFIFRTTDRSLWFDADGNGAGAAILVADLQAGAVVTAADIQLI
jgi:Ca2+-binding RTX toxin-like protein